MYELDRCVFVANGEAQAQQVRAFLRASGILSNVRGESIRNVHGLSVGDLGAVEILVSQADEDEARSLLRSVEAGEFHLDEDVDTDS
jgi:Putative prokaryotic signal transducing protein